MKPFDSTFPPCSPLTKLNLVTSRHLIHASMPFIESLAETLQWNELRKKLTRLIMFRRNNMSSKDKPVFGLGYLGLVINLILLFIGIFTSLLLFNAIAWVIVGLSVNFFDHVIRNSKSSKRSSARCSSVAQLSLRVLFIACSQCTW